MMRTTSFALAPMLLAAACGGGAAAPAPAEKPRGVVVVSLDTCRRDHFGAYGYARPTTPNIDRLAQRAAVFENAFVQSNETVFSHASILTSRYPRDLAPLDFDFRIPDAAPRLAERFKQAGFATAGFVGGGHLRSGFGFGRGFDVYFDELDFGSLFHTAPRAFQWLEQRGQERFFLFLHGYDCHSSYSKPLFFENLYDPDYPGEVADQIAQDGFGIERIFEGRYFPGLRPTLTRNTEGRPYLAEDFFQSALPEAYARGDASVALSEADARHLVAHYDGGLTYADLFVGLLLERLQRLGLFERTVLVILSDHGEDLGAHRYFHHRPVLYDDVVHVPLIVSAPGVPQSRGRRVDSMVELVDLGPTLLELAGLPRPEAVDGRSLVPLLSGTGGARPLAFSESRAHVSVRSAGAQLLVRKTAEGIDEASAELLNLRGAGETRGDPAGPQAAPLREALRAWLDAHGRPTRPDGGGAP